MQEFGWRLRDNGVFESTRFFCLNNVEHKDLPYVNNIFNVPNDREILSPGTDWWKIVLGNEDKCECDFQARLYDKLFQVFHNRTLNFVSSFHNVLILLHYHHHVRSTHMYIMDYLYATRIHEILERTKAGQVIIFIK